jgi:regulator of replication initiation timing
MNKMPQHLADIGHTVADIAAQAQTVIEENLQLICELESCRLQVTSWQRAAAAWETRAEAAETERNELWAALAELARVADPHQNMGDIPILDALARAERVLGK